MPEKKFLSLVGSRIKQTRIEKNLSQVKLAELCQFEKASMSRIESGRTNVTVLTLCKISDALGVPPHTLLHEVQNA
jgi:transcriptional regulator with XRE-family HTH domain